MNTVIVKGYDAPPIKRGEIYRYAGVDKPFPELEDMVDSLVSELTERLSLKVCYGRFEIKELDGILDLGFARTDSKKLMKNLEGCSGIILFGATVGIELDRAIKRNAVTSPTKALILQAFGAERIESLCDAFCRDMGEMLSEEGYFTRPRFSPGYGDLPLEIQRDIFDTLELSKRIGMTLCDSLLISPSKSVTAIMGYGKK